MENLIGGLLSAIGIAGIDRLVQKNFLAMSGRAAEAAGDVDVLLLDKTGTITLFSVANDVAKYFAIIPAMLMATFPQIAPFNVMKLASPESAILSAVIFNALIIIALVLLALKGIKFRPLGAVAVLRRNLLIYGLGGVIVPFVGIKLIDLIVVAFHLA
jgi:potassium-transporting ATPase ATP-binding subunit